MARSLGSERGGTVARSLGGPRCIPVPTNQTAGSIPVRGLPVSGAPSFGVGVWAGLSRASAQRWRGTGLCCHGSSPRVPVAFKATCSSKVSKESRTAKQPPARQRLHSVTEPLPDSAHTWGGGRGREPQYQEWGPGGHHEVCPPCLIRIF